MTEEMRHVPYHIAPAGPCDIEDVARLFKEYESHIGVDLAYQDFDAMPTIAERNRQVTLKVERAKSHINDLDREIRAFLDTKPYAIETKRNPQTRQLIYYVSRVKPIPESLSLIAGDAIQNLVSALDHLAYQIVGSDTGDKYPTPNRIYFPIADDAKEYEAIKAKKMKGADKATLDAIDTLKPYKGGNDSLWMLARLNNIDKHRLLITVGSTFRSVNLGARILREVNKEMPDGQRIEGFDLWIKPADSLFPLKRGDELFIDAPDSEPNDKMQFRFDVALYEPQIVEAQSILEALHQLTALVESIVATLVLRFRATP